MKKIFVSVLLTAGLSVMSGGSVFGAIPQAYWQYQQPFLDAAAANNTDEIIRLGTEISSLFVNAPNDADKAGILYSTYEKMYPAYEKKGNYEKAIACLKALIPYGQQLGFSDGVKIAKERIQKIDPMTEVYALTQNTNTTPYYGMKNEPKSGIYFGRVQSETAEPASSQEGIVSFYVECLQEDIKEYDYLIRPYADGKRVIHIALNMPQENDSLKKVLDSSSDSYLQSTMQYLSSLNCPVLLRIGGEMDVWTNLADPALFKEAYIKIATIARNHASNVALLFSPNIVSNWNVEQEQYYPGDQYVDWVGVSLYYNKYRNASNPTAMEDFEEMYYGNGIYSHPLTALKKIVDCYGDRKPIIITEGGAGHHISGSGVDLTGYAQNRLKEFYTYVNMVYPQVKGAIYFDADLGGSNEYVYALSQNAAVNTTYKNTISNNKGALSTIGATPMAYVKAEAYQDTLDTISLYGYCALPSDSGVTVTYTLDGAVIATQTQMPYGCEIQKNALTQGSHTLTVTFKGGNGYEKIKNFVLTKDASGVVTIKSK